MRNYSEEVSHGHLCVVSVTQTLTKCVEAGLMSDRFPSNVLSWWLSTSKLDNYSGGHCLVVLYGLDCRPNQRVCVADQLPEAIVPALAFVVCLTALAITFN